MRLRDGPSSLPPLQGRRLGAGPGQNPGPPGLGLSRGGAGGLPALRSSWARPGPEVGLREGSGEGMWKTRVRLSFVGFLFFVFLKKKKSAYGPVCVSCCGRQWGGGQTERSLGGAQAASPRERRIAGVGPGGRDCELLPRWFIQPRTDGSLCRRWEGGSTVTLGVWASLPSISQRSGTWLSGCARLLVSPESGLRAVRTGRSWG